MSVAVIKSQHTAVFTRRIVQRQNEVTNLESSNTY